MIHFFLGLSAIAAGAMNAIAGGGTLLTFPSLDAALQALGYDSIVTPAMANMTSTVALVPGSIAGTWGFRREFAACRSWLWLLTIPSLIGGAFGAWLLIVLPPAAFKAVVPWLVLLAVALFIAQPWVIGYVRKHRPTGPPSMLAKIGVVLAQLVIATYGGYFGAGIGILMLSTLGFLDLPSIHAMNGVKTFLAACINGISVVFFVSSGKIEWSLALLMAVFAIAGGYLGAVLSLRLKPAAVRWVVIAIGVTCAVYFFRQQG
jgi:uncharacterized membrane protein YfcA